MVLKISTTLVFFLVLFVGYGQFGEMAWNKLSDQQKDMNSAYCLTNNEQNRKYLQELGITIKRETNQWLFFTATANQLQKALVEDQIQDFYLEYTPATLLNDSTRAVHHVDEVHDGIGLPSSYQGEGVIIGVVDTGVDWRHPDYYDENGNTRIIRYWDHSTNTGGPSSPYGYGIVWDSTHINNLTITSNDGHSHGTTVTGAAAGNGFGGGYNQGMAPKSSIIMVETNFSLPNWTLTVADACDYIFKVADSLDMPAVVNLSLGTYIGSHDGDDPASVEIEALLDEKDGRIVVSACGNSGAYPPYHVQADIDADTSFVWIKNNASNFVFFDLWADTADVYYNFNLSVVNPANNFDLRGQTIFRNARSTAGTLIYDTIWNGSNRLATIQMVGSFSGDSYHYQGYVSMLDTASYNVGFNTYGNGGYDLWSGSISGYNNFVEIVPDVAVYPNIIHYNFPDTLQSIVSAWNCSEKVISVGNIHNRWGFDNYAGGYYLNSGLTHPGKLSVNSSKGPSRRNLVKPDVVANGDVSLTTGPLWYLSNVGNYSKIDTSGWYMANGGTSMSSPVVAGIAALYLERCSRGNYASFKNDVLATAFPNAYSGTLPNYGFGYGLINAHEMLLLNNFSATISGDTSLCVDPNVVDVSGSVAISTVEWSNGQVGPTGLASEAGYFYGTAFNASGCGVPTDSLEFVQLDVPVIDPIIVDIENQLLTTNSSTDYQWTLDGVDLMGEVNSTLSISEPYGVYTCYAVSGDGCIASTEPVGIYVGVQELNANELLIYPNPVMNEIQIGNLSSIDQIRIFNQNGQQIEMKIQANNSVIVRDLAPGIYFVELISEGKTFISKFVKE